MMSTLATDLDLQVITITVADLERSRQFYEGVLEFEVRRFYEPTRWVAYRGKSGAFFAVMESTVLEATPLDEEIVFYSNEIEALWERLQGKVCVKEPLQITLWGAVRFVIFDPDGYQLVFIKTPEN
jgi:catechol 2,3-dioxygenase-like lactoylglutathione lyase family enzyme